MFLKLHVFLFQIHFCQVSSWVLVQKKLLYKSNSTNEWQPMWNLISNDCFLQFEWVLSNGYNSLHLACVLLSCSHRAQKVKSCCLYHAEGMPNSYPSSLDVYCYQSCAITTRPGDTAATLSRKVSLTTHSLPHLGTCSEPAQPLSHAIPTWRAFCISIHLFSRLLVNKKTPVLRSLLRSLPWLFLASVSLDTHVSHTRPCVQRRSATPTTST